MKSHSRRKLVVLEPLEGRRMLATYGNPWPDGSRMTLSFAPDTTPISSLNSRLFNSLDAALPRAIWQTRIAQAFQRWAIHTDVNVGFRSDSGLRFGTPGVTLGDPRFGDVRIAAHAMSPEVLAISVPYDPARSGTLTGDVFLNSTYSFNGTYDLFSVMLHEAGHVFGLDHSADPDSPMFDRFNNPKTLLTSGDIQAIRTLYGDRLPDRHDSAGSNDTFGNATVIERPNSYDGSTPLAVFGDLTTGTDVDFYKFTKPTDDNGYIGPVTVRLQTSGISFMQPSVQVLDSTGTQIASAVSSSFLGDVLTVTFQAEGDESDYYLRVDIPDGADFAIGRYFAAVVFNGRNTVNDATIESVLTGPYETADAETLRALFLSASSVFINPDAGQDNTIGTAKNIGPAAPHESRSTLEEFASIHTTSDVDFVQFATPQSSVTTLTITLWSTDARGLIPSLQMYSAAGTPIASRVIANGNRTVTLQVDAPAPSANFVAKVSAAGGLGNYSLSVDFQTAPAVLDTFATGSFGGADHLINGKLYISQTQLMHLVLSTESEEGEFPVQVTVIDSGGRTRFSATAYPGETVSGASVMFTPGEYCVIYRVLTPTGPTTPKPPDLRTLVRENGTASRGRVLPSRLIEPPPPALPEYTFALAGSSLSGPIGPAVNDPTLAPTYVSPISGFIYPGGVAWPLPFLWILIGL